MDSLALAAASTGTTDAAPALSVALTVIAVWWISTHGKGSAALQLIAWTMAIGGLWLLDAVHDPAQAGHIASGAASGVAVAISAVSQFANGI